MKPRFQADNDLRGAIWRGVLRREPSIDFQSAREVELDGVPDSEVLRVASMQNRILISHDENTMPSHFKSFLAAGYESPGLLIVSQSVATNVVIESILLIWIASESDDWKNKIAWLPL